MKVNELRTQRAGLIEQARAAFAGADAAKRAPTDEERAKYDEFMKQAGLMKADILRLEALETEERELAQTNAEPNKPNPKIEAPNLNLKTKLGDSEIRAAAHYIRTGDGSGLKRDTSFGVEQRASNNTDMNITTPADGGYAVPVGHYQGIIAKRDELMIPQRVGVMNIPGIGATVNVPYDDGTANEFVSTAETVGFDQDAPVLNQAAMTLVLYSKKCTFSYQLLNDEDSRLMEFLNDYVGRALALTHNDLFITECLASGTAVALGAAAAVTAGDPETLSYAIKPEYLDNCAFIMARATEGKIRKLTGNLYQYQATPANGSAPNPSPAQGGGELVGFPIFNSTKVPVVGAGNKSMLFGNFSRVGMREAPSLTFLRDPYTGAGNGQVILYYYLQTVYKVLTAEAVLYGKHPTA